MAAPRAPGASSLSAEASQPGLSVSHSPASSAAAAAAAAPSPSPSASGSGSAPTCNECGVVAIVRCHDCEDDWCAECSADFHRMKKTRMHRRSDILLHASGNVELSVSAVAAAGRSSSHQPGAASGPLQHTSDTQSSSSQPISSTTSEGAPRQAPASAAAAAAATALESAVFPLTPTTAAAIMLAARDSHAPPAPFRLRAGGDVYECTEWLGGGGFGAVWKAHKSGEQHRPLAVKFARLVDKEGLSTTSQQLRRMREPELQRELDHPNIVHLHTSETYGDVCVMVMEYCAGGSLHDYLKQRGALSAAEARHFMLQLRDGLMLLRELKIVHRDLKPANLMLSADRTQIKIGDFGLARKLDDGSLTAVGTFAYMAPECTEGRPHDRSDLWSVGSILAEMLLPRDGLRPFLFAFNERDEAALARIQQASLPRSCLELLFSLLHRNPEDRSWDEFATCVWMADPYFAWDEAIFAASRVFIPPPPCSLSSDELYEVCTFLQRCFTHGMSLGEELQKDAEGRNSDWHEDLAVIEQATEHDAREAAFVVIASRLAGDEGRPSGWMEGQGAELAPLAVSIGFYSHQSDIIKPPAIIRREGKLMLDLYPDDGRLLSLRLSICRFHHIPPGSRYCLMHFLGTFAVREKYYSAVRYFNMLDVTPNIGRHKMVNAFNLRALVPLGAAFPQTVTGPPYPVSPLPWPNSYLVERIRSACRSADVDDDLRAFGIEAHAQSDQPQAPRAAASEPEAAVSESAAGSAAASTSSSQ